MNNTLHSPTYPGHLMPYSNASPLVSPPVATDPAWHASSSPAFGLSDTNPSAQPAALATDGTRQETSADQAAPQQARELFQDFVGQTLYGQLLKTMWDSVPKSEYFHGGRAEEIFQSQLNQVISERMADASGDSFSDPLFDLMQLQRPM